MVLLIATPLILALLVILLTRKPNYTYSSETTLYTGIASGSSVEMDKAFSYFANNTAFDNLINVINSRETQQEVAIRLLAQHLILKSPDPRYISAESFADLNKITPAYIRKLVAKSYTQSPVYFSKPQPPKTATKVAARTSPKTEPITHTVSPGETVYSISRWYNVPEEQIRSQNDLEDNAISPGQVLKISPAGADSPGNALADTTAGEARPDSASSFSFSDLYSSDDFKTLPASINREGYEQTILSLKAYMASNDTNFVYRLLYFEDPHYSIKAISTVNVQRIASSDLVKLKFDSDDPGICQQTLAMLTQVCIVNYKLIKENRSDAVVKYFEYQLKQSAGRLKIGEDKLLKFNEDNNIINYYEQSKAVAVVKEDLDVDYHNKRIKLAGLKAAIARIEDKLGNQKLVQLKSSTIIDKRNQLSEINSKLANVELAANGNPVDDKQLAKLKFSALKLKDEIRVAVNDLYSYGNSVDGLPISTLLNDWINNVIEYEDTKAGLEVLGDRIKDFQKQYAIYAPAGANIKRIEREISVSEQEFLEILHGLNLAKLKLQDAELSSSIKAVDPPFYPLSPNPTKRKILVIVAALFGFLVVFSSIMAMEYFDETLKNAANAEKVIRLKAIGVFPKIIMEAGTLNFPFITNRLLEIVLQQIDMLTDSKAVKSGPRIILMTSSNNIEGKTVTGGNIAWKLKNLGKKVLYLNFSHESLRSATRSQVGYPDTSRPESPAGFSPAKNRSRFITRMLGYGDNRTDPFSPFLQNPEHYLYADEYFQYPITPEYYETRSYIDLLENSGISYDAIPDYVIIEIPPILYYSFPQQLVASADLAILVCRANRVWSAADQGALDLVMKISSREPVILLNGVDLIAVESILGDLPRKRSRLRRIFKNLVRLQFYARQQP